MIFDDAVRSHSLAQSDLAVVEYIRQHPHDVVHMTSQELGEAAFVSASTVTRLCKKAGFASFNDMKVTLARELADEESYQHVDSDFPQLAGIGAARVVTTISSMEREAIRKTERLLAGVAWEPLLETMESVPEITLVAFGTSRAACSAFVDNLRHVGKRVHALSDLGDAQHWAGTCPRDEFFIFVSYSGEGPHIEAPARVLARRGLRFAAITADHECPLRRMASWHLPLALTGRRHMYNRIAPFQSTNSTAYALDVLFAQLLSRNYQRYAQTISRSLELQDIVVDVDEQGEVTLSGSGARITP